MSNYQELRDAIAAATPGPWSKGSDSHWGTEVRGPDNQTVAHCGGIADQARRNIEYLIAANPQTIRDLLSDLDAAHEEIARLRELTP